jgi:hypothetical protein
VAHPFAFFANGWDCGERKKYREAVKKYVSDTLSELNGFAAFDEIDRYRINFPNGWSPTP